MAEERDAVQQYAASLGLEIRTRTVLVEGTTDVELFALAARLERSRTGIDLFGDDFAIIAAGKGDRGGVSGVVRELSALRLMAQTSLLPNGRPRYRFLGLFDNDHAGREAVQLARHLDTSILEYKDILRLHPAMPLPGILDPATVKKGFERENDPYEGLDWEVEDLLHPDFIAAFRGEFPQAVARSLTRADKTHLEFTRDGKARLHRFVRENAMHEDLAGVILTLRTLRRLVALPPLDAAAPSASST